MARPGVLFLAALHLFLKKQSNRRDEFRWTTTSTENYSRQGGALHTVVGSVWSTTTNLPQQQHYSPPPVPPPSPRLRTPVLLYVVAQKMVQTEGRGRETKLRCFSPFLVINPPTPHPPPRTPNSPSVSTQECDLCHDAHTCRGAENCLTEGLNELYGSWSSPSGGPPSRRLSSSRWGW